MEQVVSSSSLVATEERLLDHFCLKARHHCDVGTSERLLNDLAETKVKIPAIFSNKDGSAPDLEYIDYEVLPEMESLINETMRGIK